MTDYTSRKSSKKRTWEKVEVARKWRAIVAAFIIVFLGFFILNGILRAFSFKNLVANSKWDGNSPFVSVFFGKVPTLAIFNKELEKVVVIEVTTDVSAQDLVYPRLTLGEVYSRGDSARTAKALSRILGINISSWATFKKSDGEEGRESVKGLFTNLGSLSGGMRAGLIGEGAFFEKTNITRIELLRLWWQVNGIGSNFLETVDDGEYIDEVFIKGAKVKVVDQESLHGLLDKYLEVEGIAQKKIKLEIVNSSGTVGLGQLVGTMATSWGFNVIRVTSGEAVTPECHITSFDRGGEAASYLANALGCDIVGAPNEAQENKIIVILGQDVSGKYF